MKKRIVVFLTMLLLFASTASATVYLTCQPYTQNPPKQFLVSINGTAYTVVNGNQIIDDVLVIMDITGKYLANQDNTILIKAKSDLGESAQVTYVFFGSASAAPSGVGLLVK